ncbi:hypothetical protein CRE_30878 [Caenorhabditis remanei]|uniref:F-box domain-containing protein n=1 Tax=Caenorhabditis remanei TaxID=31234 RepID=E3LUS4_CAERE|nr:hypothetical protein CRE_30878 [Caenorhabditis remanei]
MWEIAQLTPFFYAVNCDTFISIRCTGKDTDLNKFQSNRNQIRHCYSYFKSYETTDPNRIHFTIFLLIFAVLTQQTILLNEGPVSIFCSTPSCHFSESVMKLLHFPTLILRNIFSNLSLSELVLLSYCSERVRNVIVSIQKNRLKKVLSILYYFDSDDDLFIGAVAETNSSHVHFKPTRKIKVENESRGSADMFEMDFETPGCLNNPYSFCEARFKYDKCKRDRIVQGIHTHLYKFFGPSVDYQVALYCYDLPPRLENINFSVITRGNFSVPTYQLEAYFNASPNQEYMHINRNFLWKLSENSVVYGTKHLEIDCYGRFEYETLLRFAGRSLILKSAILSHSTIIRFLNDWKSSRGFQNLISLSITCPDSKPLKPEKIEKHVDINVLERSLKLEWKERACIYVTQPKKWIDRRLNSDQYLIRDSDAAGASIKINTNDFTFIVWSATETLR